jgi:hypothetical protein
MPDPVTDWSDFEWFLQSYIIHQTIPIIRSFGGFVERATSKYLGLRQGEKKDILAEKLRAGFRDMKDNNQFEQYRNVRLQCEQVGRPLRNPQAAPGYPPQVPTFGGAIRPATVTNGFGSGV